MLVSGLPTQSRGRRSFLHVVFVLGLFDFGVVLLSWRQENSHLPEFIRFMLALWRPILMLGGAGSRQSRIFVIYFDFGGLGLRSCSFEPIF